MSGPARVSSIQALREFRSALAVFGEEARAAIESAASEITRVTQHTSADLPSKWQGEQRRWEEEVVRARIALEHAHSMADMGKSAIDEKRALQRAKDNVQNARDKLSATKRWARELEREMTLYRGQIEPLLRLIEANAPTAMMKLGRMTDQLEHYTKVAQPESQHTGQHIEREMAHAVSAGHEGRSDAAEYQRLRALLASDRTIQDAPRRESHDLEMSPLRLDQADRRAMALLGTDAPAPDLRLDLALAIKPSDATLIAQRVEPVDDTDSGWRLHTDPCADTWIRVPAVRLLSLLPDLASIARSPLGSAVVIADASVRSVFDTIGDDVWREVAAPEPPDERGAD